MTADNTIAKTTRRLALHFEPGRPIFNEGDPSEFAYRVLQGRVELYSLQAGREVSIAMVEAGALVGEMGLIAGEPRSLSARATDAVILEKLDREAFFDELAADPAFARSILTDIVYDLRRTSERYIDQSAAIAAAAESAGTAPAHTKRSRGFVLRMDPRPEDFSADSVELMTDQPDRSGVVPLVMGVLGAFFAIVIAWTAFAPIEQAVTVRGEIVTDTPNIVLQPLETAQIVALSTAVGVSVKQGDVLMRLDPTFAEAEAAADRAGLDQLDARLARLRAAFTDARPESFSPDAEENALQLEILSRSRDERDGRLAALDGRLAEIGARIASAEQDVAALDRQLINLRELERTRQGLAQRGSGSRLQFLAARYDRLSASRRRADTAAEIAALAHDRDATIAERAAFEAQWYADIGEEITRVARERDELAERQAGAAQRVENVAITAPVDGVILELGDVSVGSIVGQGDALVTVVPSQAPLEIELEIPTGDVGDISRGDLARVKLDSLPFQKHGMVYGAVRVISSDAITREERAGDDPVFIARADITETRFRNLPETFRLQAGMTLTADVRTGEDSVLGMLWSPFATALATSFREP